MKTTTISDRDAFELAQGRVSARPDLDSLADLLTAYRIAAIGSVPQPSAALRARVDLSATPIAMQRDVVVDGDMNGVATRRAASGLLGLGVIVAIILGAASGAAAVVGIGTAGLLPPVAQGVFDQVVSDSKPPGVVGEETTDQGEAPGVTTGGTETDESTEEVESGGTPETESADTGVIDPKHGNGAGTPGKEDKENGLGNSGHNNGVGSSGEDNGFGNAGDNNGNGNGNGNGGDLSDDDSSEKSNNGKSDKKND
jgi:hypothetical protein